MFLFERLGVSKSLFGMENTKYSLYSFLRKKKGIIRDAQVFEPTYIPDTLVHREKELQYLATHFSSILYNQTQSLGKHAIIQGPVGVGKTVVAQNLGSVIETFSHGQESHDTARIRYFHLNCRRLKSWYLLLTSLLRHLIPAFPIRGFSTSELLSYLSTILEEKKIGMLLCLDEIDYLLGKPQGLDVLYSLIRGHENIQGSQVSLILITRNPEFLAILDPALLSSLSHYIILFKPYSSSQLFDILAARARQGFNPSTISHNVLHKIATMASTRDARYAIELLWRSAKVAEQDITRHINSEHVRRAEGKVFSLNPGTLKELPRQLKMVLSALSNMLTRDGVDYVTTRDLWKKYEELCIERKIKPRQQTQFWHYLRDLGAQGIIHFEVQSRHFEGKSIGRTARIGLVSFTANDLHRILVP